MSLRFSIIPVTSYQQNCTLLICNKSNKAAIVDPGGEIDVILKTIDQENAVLEKILVTHAHLDHIGAVAELASMLSIPIEGPQQEDKFWIDLIPQQIETFGFPHSEAFTPTRWLNDGNTVNFRLFTAQAILLGISFSSIRNLNWLSWATFFLTDLLVELIFQKEIMQHWSIQSKVSYGH